MGRDWDALAGSQFEGHDAMVGDDCCKVASEEPQVLLRIQVPDCRLQDAISLLAVRPQQTACDLGLLSHEHRCHAAYDAAEDAGANTATSFAIWHHINGHESSKDIRDIGKEEQLQKCGMLTGMSISQPRWCHCSVMEELSNSGSSSKWRFSMATARAPSFSAVPQICKVRQEYSSACMFRFLFNACREMEELSYRGSS